MEGMPQNKRESPISRVVGEGDEDEKKLLEFFSKQFKREKIAEWSKELPKELCDVISILNKDSKEFFKKYGIEAIDIPVENIKILDRSKLTPEQTKELDKEYKNIGGFYNVVYQHITMLCDYTENEKLRFAQLLIHEMIHLNSFQSLQRAREKEESSLNLTYGGENGEAGKEISLVERRVGFSIGTEQYFGDINEAITQELAMRFEKNYFVQIPQIEKEYKKVQAFIASESKERQENMWNNLARIQTEQHEDGKWQTRFEDYAFTKERKDLNKLIDELYEKNKEKFFSREDVFDIFAKAAMTGELLEVGRLITKTYGHGSFRELGKKTAKKKEAEAEAK